MNPKSIGLATMYAIIGMSMCASSKGGNDGSYGHGIPDKPKKIIPKGCKEYKFYGITVVASSENKAREKARKIYDKQNS